MGKSVLPTSTKGRDNINSNIESVTKRINASLIPLKGKNSRDSHNAIKNGDWVIR